MDEHEEEEEVDPKIGLLLNDRYRIVRKLGEGGMGAVYEGKHEMINRSLAIKCLHPQFMANKEVVERFHREANAATAVGNEHIIEVTDVGSFDDGSPFIVMEKLDGIEFGDLLDEVGGISVGRMVHIVNQVCEALQAAHDQGIVHRDMKPENVFLIKRSGDEDFVKVLDFGISKMAESAESLGNGLTKTGMALGTPYYMPPEQAQGVRDIDHRADVYACGVIMFQALTNRLPFDAESYPALMVKIMTEEAPDVSLFRRDLPVGLSDVVMRAMAKDRDRRFQTMNDLAVALGPFSQAQAAAVMVTNPPVSPLASTQASGETTPFAWTQGEAASGAPPAGGGATQMDAFDGTQVPTRSDAGGQPQDERPITETRVAYDSGSTSKAPLIGAGIIAAAVIGAGLIISLGNRPAPAAPAVDQAAAALPTAAPVPAALPMPAPAAPSQPAAKPTEVQIKIGATPDKARIFIGEVEFPNPMDAWRPRSLDPIRIRVQAAGHQTIEQLAIFDQTRELTFALEKGKGVKRLKAMKRGAPAPQSAPAKTAAARAAAAPRPAAPKPATAPKPEPKPVAPAAGDKIYRGPSGAMRDEF